MLNLSRDIPEESRRMQPKRKTPYIPWQTVYLLACASVIAAYVLYDPYQIDGDAVSYMDIASAIIHKHFSAAINGLWNPGYPALLAIPLYFFHPAPAKELQLFYWINYAIFIFSLFCTKAFVREILKMRELDSAIGHRNRDWMLSEEICFVTAYSIVLLSWINEFSIGKIRVDALYASFLLLAFCSLFKLVASEKVVPAFSLGIFLGLAYLVKSPGFVIAIFVAFIFSVYVAVTSISRARVRQMICATVAFVAVASPYIIALSHQKHRFDFGDSARLNYAWLVAGTATTHLLNDQPGRFGDADVHLQHPQTKVLSNPIVVTWRKFPNATYPPWFDPSYFNDGITPHFSLERQIRRVIGQSKSLITFLVTHGLVFALLGLAIYCGAEIRTARSIQIIVVLIYFLATVSFLMYLSVLFLDRYVAGILWVIAVSTFGFFTVNHQRSKLVMEGAAVFMSIVVLLTGVQHAIQMRREVAWSGVSRGWQESPVFDVARELNEQGVSPGTPVACYRACNRGAYWARLAGVRIVSEISDSRYMQDMGNGAAMWDSLPNHPALLAALASTGAKALVGYFEFPPSRQDGWRPLSGRYYWLPLTRQR